MAGLDEPGTTAPALKAGFLCVISLLSTFRSPFVTSSPRFRAANTAAAPPLLLAVDAAGVGGAGGGGGAVAAAAAAPDLYASTVIPYSEAFMCGHGGSCSGLHIPWGSIQDQWYDIP